MVGNSAPYSDVSPHPKKGISARSVEAHGKVPISSVDFKRNLVPTQASLFLDAFSEADGSHPVWAPGDNPAV